MVEQNNVRAVRFRNGRVRSRSGFDHSDFRALESSIHPSMTRQLWIERSNSDNNSGRSAKKDGTSKENRSVIKSEQGTF